ncbi:MAG: D-glycero-beta-D-manno-heptose-7-phosphate kinase [Candidatus Latescibacteria bacterium]|nr:D-glycero-beta-D-manno-heptose-7-phosphate kinase [Candidatus Latescibacterota bacterium]
MSRSGRSLTDAVAGPGLTRAELTERVHGFGGRRVVVIGDIILDRYLWGSATRVSPEAPVLVVDVEREELRLGGAANVAHNVRALGALPTLVGVVGKDAAAESLKRELKARSVDSDGGVLTDPARRTSLKTRIVAHEQQVLRADEETRGPVAPTVLEELWQRVERALSTADAVLVSDYGKGVVTPALLDRLLPELKRRGIPSAVDPKEEHFFCYNGVHVITPNVAEASQAWGRRIRAPDDLLEAGFGLRERLSAHAVLITRGAEGMSLFTSEGHTHFPTRARKVYDVTGAGDTVVATIAAALAAGASLAEACVLANHAAGIVVAELGTAVATGVQLIESLEELPNG